MNRKQLIGILMVFLAAILLESCAYTHIQRPLDTHFDNTRLGTKIGKASSYSILWLFAWGNAGTQAAAKNGGIKVIQHADIGIESVLFGLYTRVTTILYGD